MDVLFLRHPDELKKTGERAESLALGYLAAFLRRSGHTAEVIDSALMDWDDERTIQEVRRRDFRLLGLSVASPSMLNKTANLLRKLAQIGLSSPIVLGGFLPSFSDVLALDHIPQAKFVVRFEGEETLSELVRKLDSPNEYGSIPGLTYRQNGRIFRNQLRPLIDSLDSLPFPARDFLSQVSDDPGYVHISSSRGCFRRCSFCTAQIFTRMPGGPKWRGRSSSSVVNEIQMLSQEHEIKGFIFVDDTFFGPGRLGRDRVRDIAVELLSRGSRIKFKFECHVADVDKDLFALLKEAGLVRVFLGIESGVQSQLDRFGKMSTVKQNLQAIDILSDLGLDVSIGFIMFDPYTTLAEVKENIEFLKRLGVYRGPHIFQDLVISCGSEMERIGSLVPGEYIHDYKLDDPRAEWLRQTLRTCRLNIAPAGSRIQGSLLKLSLALGSETLGIANTASGLDSELMQLLEESVGMAEGLDSHDQSELTSAKAETLIKRSLSISDKYQALTDIRNP